MTVLNGNVIIPYMTKEIKQDIVIMTISRKKLITVFNKLICFTVSP